MIDSNALATKKTAADLVEAYRFALDHIREATVLIYEAQARLDEAFGASAYVDIKLFNGRYTTAKEAIELSEKEMRKPAWRRITDITNVTKVMSVKQSEQMSKSLYSGDLPEVTLEEVLGMLNTLFDNVNTFAEEAVAEVYEILRPAARESGQGRYKTNEKNARYNIGKKVILPWIIERDYSGNVRIRCGGTAESKLVAIDRVFHALDGNLSAMDKSNRTPMIDAVNTANGWGETDYFRFRACKNGNLHLEFKRLDLVKQINAIGAKQAAELGG